MQTSKIMPCVDDDELLTRVEAARFLTAELKHRTAPQTLARLATTGGGPTFQKSGRWPVYTKGALRRWVAGRTTPPVGSVAEATAFKSQSPQAA